MTRYWKRIIGGMIALSLLSACSQDEPGENSTALPEGEYPLQIGSVIARRRIPVADRQRHAYGGGERTAVDAGQRKPGRRDEQRVQSRRCHWCQS